MAFHVRPQIRRPDRAASSARRLARPRLNEVDDLILNLAAAGDVWSVHCELGLSGRLDPERVARAASEACARHPMARAALEPVRRFGWHRRWRIAEGPVRVPVEERACADERELAAARARALGRQVDLEAAPPFELTLLHGPDGDLLLMNLDHAAGDGMSAHRLLTSIARAYAGAPDPTPETDGSARRSLRRRAGARRLGDLRERADVVRERVSDQRRHGPLARVAPTAGREGRDGYGFAVRALTAEEGRAVQGARAGAATVNDVLVGSLAVAIARHNAERGLDPRRVSVMMPVNLRERGAFTELVGNVVSFVSVSVPPADQVDLRSAAGEVARRTGRAKTGGRAGTLVDGLSVGRLLPYPLRRAAVAGPVQRSIGQVLDTAVLSNLGRPSEVPDFGPGAPAVESLWFSPPARMPLGVAAGAASVGDRLCLTLRWCGAQFDEADGERFLERWRAVLLGG